MIKFLSGSNQINDAFSFSIYKNQGICSLEIVGSIDTDGYAWGVSTLEKGVKIYALVTCNYAGLKIIEVSDP